MVSGLLRRPLVTVMSNGANAQLPRQADQSLSESNEVMAVTALSAGMGPASSKANWTRGTWRPWQGFLQIYLIVRHLEIGSKSEPLSGSPRSASSPVGCTIAYPSTFRSAAHVRSLLSGWSITGWNGARISSSAENTRAGTKGWPLPQPDASMMRDSSPRLTCNAPRQPTVADGTDPHDPVPAFKMPAAVHGHGRDAVARRDDIAAKPIVGRLHHRMRRPTGPDCNRHASRLVPACDQFRSHASVETRACELCKLHAGNKNANDCRIVAECELARLSALLTGARIFVGCHQR